MLAEAFYRRDDFQKAAAALRGVDVSSNKLVREQYPTLNVPMLESFKGKTPYELKGNGTSTRVKFVKTDPLPVINVRVNGGKEVTFFIDTGGSRSRSTRISRRSLASAIRDGAGLFRGAAAEVQLGRIESLHSAIGPSKTFRRQCFLCANFRRIGRETNRRNYRDHSVLPFPDNDGLSARRACATPEDCETLKEFIQSPGKRVVVPMWMASDHFMVGWGRVKQLRLRPLR